MKLDWDCFQLHSSLSMESKGMDPFSDLRENLFDAASIGKLTPLALPRCRELSAIVGNSAVKFEDTTLKDPDPTRIPTSRGLPTRIGFQTRTGSRRQGMGRGRGFR